jgi:hypothetical protein
MEPIKAYIHSIQGEYAYFNISTDTNGKISSFKQKFRLNNIKFKNEPAPRALLTENAPAFCRLTGNTITEAYLDPDIEIIVVFGKIISVDPNNQSLTVSDDFNSNEISWSIFKSSNSQKIPQNIILNSVGSPVIIYYNLDSVIECKSAEESKEFSLTLDNFKLSKSKEEEKEVFCFKDSRLILHKIAAQRVFFRNSNKPFTINLVKEKLGVGVKVFVKNREFRAEVAVDPPNNTEISIKHVKDDSYTIPKKIDYTNTSSTHSSRKGNNTYDVQKNNYPFQAPALFNSQQKLYGKRIFDSSEQYYCKPNENFNSNFMVLLGLFEIVFRFPDHKTKIILYQQLIQESQKLGNSGLKKIIDEVFQIYRDHRIKTRIEEVYRNIIVNKGIYEALIKNLIKDPINYDELAELYEISFWVNTSNNEWRSYYPFSIVGKSFPYIIIKDSPKFCIMYSPDMMQLDGYDLKSLEYTIPQNLDLEKVKCPYHAPSIEAIEIFQNILDLESFSSELAKGSEERFNQLLKKLNCSLKGLSSLAKPEQFETLSETFIKMNQVKVKDLSCQCGNEENCRYFCSNGDSLCKICALASTRIGKCLYCNVYVDINVNGESYECLNCKVSYEPKYNVGFPCNCVYCTGCANTFIEGKYCYAHEKQIPDDIITSIYQYLQKIWYESNS